MNRFEGTKKLVPALRSSSNSTPAASKTGNPSRLSTAVTNQFQHVNGNCIIRKPACRRSRVVAMKLMAPIVDATQKMPMLTIHNVWPGPWPGPETAPTALKGGYAVQPDSGAPPRMKNAASKTRKETAVSQKDTADSNGNAVCRATI